MRTYYDCDQDMLQQILTTPLAVLIVETESTAFNALETVLEMHQLPECMTTKFVMLTPIRIQHQQSIGAYWETFKIKTGFGAYITIPFRKAELAHDLHRMIECQDIEIWPPNTPL